MPAECRETPVAAGFRALSAAPRAGGIVARLQRGHCIRHEIDPSRPGHCPEFPESPSGRECRPGRGHSAALVPGEREVMPGGPAADRLVFDELGGDHLDGGPGGLVGEQVLGFIEQLVDQLRGLA